MGRLADILLLIWSHAYHIAYSERAREAVGGRLTVTLRAGRPIMDISVHVKPEAAAGLREGRSVDGKDVQELLEVTRELGVDIRPVFPIASTPEEAGLYVVQVKEPSKTEEVVRKLSDCSAVETAYHVPAAELP
jgi:hypothetical protein